MSTRKSYERKDPNAQAMASKGSSKGGRNRARSLTPTQRSIIASKGAHSRPNAGRRAKRPAK